jgi:hypothetical protein
MSRWLISSDGDEAPPRLYKGLIPVQLLLGKFQTAKPQNGGISEVRDQRSEKMNGIPE